jgi:hypothetical protein
VVSRDLDRAARAAVERHKRLLHHKTLELVLGAMVAQDGIDKTRRILEWYLRQLEDY